MLQNQKNEIMNLKKIHIGELIYIRVKEYNVDISRICNFFHCTEKEINEMYKQEDLYTGILLAWSKLLDYDFFRLYTQHLILYSPQGNKDYKKTTLPKFRKNIYTKEVINYILELIQEGKKTRKEVIDEYRIPKTTLYKWIVKYIENNKIEK